MCVRTSPSRWIMQALIASFVFAAVAYGQNQTPALPNLSGTWELVDIDGNRDHKNPKFPKMTLIVEQEANQLKVTEKRIKRGSEEVRTFVYQTDGRGDTNTSRVEVWRAKDRQLESVTRTEENRIVTEYKREVALGTATRLDPLDTKTQQTDVWSLEASGKTLKLTTKSTVIRSATTEWYTYKLKFRRIEPV